MWMELQQFGALCLTLTPALLAVWLLRRLPQGVSIAQNVPKE